MTEPSPEKVRPPARALTPADWTSRLIYETLNVIIIVPACRRELDAFPTDVRSDLADVLARLDAGLMLAMPLSRAMPSIGRAVHELRLRDRSGHYRVIYALIRRGAVHVLHAFKKITQPTPRRHIDLARKRLKEMTQ